MKQPHEYWYFFGKCTPYPLQIKGFPIWPYKKFETKEECQKYIDSLSNKPSHYKLIISCNDKEWDCFQNGKYIKSIPK